MQDLTLKYVSMIIEESLGFPIDKEIWIDKPLAELITVTSNIRLIWHFSKQMPAKKAYLMICNT